MWRSAYTHLNSVEINMHPALNSMEINMHPALNSVEITLALSYWQARVKNQPRV